MRTPSLLASIGVALKYTAVICLFALCGIILLNIVLRTFFSISLVWSFEVAQLLVIWVAFLGAAMAFFLREKGHIQVRVVIGSLPAEAQRLVQVLCNIVSILVLSVILYGAIERSPTAWTTSRGVVEWLSFGWYYLGLIVGVVLSMIFLAVWTIDIIVNKQESDEGDT